MTRCTSPTAVALGLAGTILAAGCSPSKPKPKPNTTRSATTSPGPDAASPVTAPMPSTAMTPATRRTAMTPATAMTPPTNAAAKPGCPPGPRGRLGDNNSGQLNRGLAGTGTAELLAAVRTTHAGWKRTKAFVAKAGTAGRWADGISVTLEKGTSKISISIHDMIRVCTGLPGTGKVVLATKPTPGVTSRPIKIGARDATLSAAGRARTLATWVGDRCAVNIESTDAASDQTLLEAATVIDWPALRKVCAARQKRQSPFGLGGP